MFNGIYGEGLESLKTILRDNAVILFKNGIVFDILFQRFYVLIVSKVTSPVIVMHQWLAHPTEMS